jgi:hypothetical protein
VAKRKGRQKTVPAKTVPAKPQPTVLTPLALRPSVQPLDHRELTDAGLQCLEVVCGLSFKPEIRKALENMNSIEVCLSDRLNNFVTSPETCMTRTRVTCLKGLRWTLRAEPKARIARQPKLITPAALVQEPQRGTLTQHPTPWVGNGLRFATREEAEAYAAGLSSGRNTRVVESSDPVNYRWENGRVIRPN